MRRLLAATLAALLVAGAAIAATETVTVVVKKTSVRRDRQFFAPTVSEAEFGAAFGVLAREKGWVKVGTNAGEGWVHESAVTAKKVAASSQAPAGAAAQEDVALAFKQFNPPVEKAYREKHPEANYAAVDRMEKLGASDAAVADFVAAGNLVPRAGK